MFGDFDLNSLMQQAQKLQEDVERAQRELESKEFEASAGGDLVSVRINGRGELQHVGISPEAWDPEDPDTLSALIIAAFRAAKSEADGAMAAAMPDLPQLPGMPGM
ncbi:hypothetical protein SAMN02745244_02015 [Tessaracoccus bendigoensis DSM 12906]|uniref:Nucleoid-associated protein SAMN02745244_02015 n=1 Tax=Tessaracoccus bendigoensis DSM 12906 TaxID=1123357 RepID=A0A1M6HLW8_9ACTN|nr:YbaB/EbfC family nucleoid-associated protein [Tessaracoccus bendigoensis]SHJ23191.1 hypothetical protein SAMN02745244_02015 [Tessaracoccus bendigoensis DSM 12906]